MIIATTATIFCIAGALVQIFVPLAAFCFFSRTIMIATTA